MKRLSYAQQAAFREEMFKTTVVFNNVTRTSSVSENTTPKFGRKNQKKHKLISHYTINSSFFQRFRHARTNVFTNKD